MRKSKKHVSTEASTGILRVPNNSSKKSSTIRQSVRKGFVVHLEFNRQLPEIDLFLLEQDMSLFGFGMSLFEHGVSGRQSNVSVDEMLPFESYITNSSVTCCLLKMTCFPCTLMITDNSCSAKTFHIRFILKVLR